MVKSKRKSSTKKIKKWYAVPLNSSFMVSSMLGFLISAYWVYPQSKNYSLAFMFVFGAMFVASLVSMTKAPLID
jgi:hypothetical protein